MKPTLLVLAAGLGSRYGGLKQLDGLGPQGQIIMDYSIHDALKAGFGNIVLIVQEPMIPVLTERYLVQQQLPVSFVIQDKKIERNNIIHENAKPWGTAHALWCAKNAIQSNFLLINADDFYGQNSFALAYTHLSQHENPCAIVFPILKTLSENGTVNRAEIHVENGFLKDSIEREKISKTNEGIFYPGSNGESVSLSENTLVSMNMWGFTPAIFDFLEKDLDTFIQMWQSNPTIEYQLPNVVTAMIEAGIYQISVIPTNEEWIGVTYQEDKQKAMEQLKKLHDLAVYSEELWK
nr:sugar phosphate nucleotidyltransferase [uncultured Flavobacterium sp.]